MKSETIFLDYFYKVKKKYIQNLFQKLKKEIYTKLLATTRYNIYYQGTFLNNKKIQNIYMQWDD